MRRKIIDGLYVGNLEDCRLAKERGGDEWAIVHACKNPCYHAECGQLEQSHEHYLARRRGWDLYLNMIDPSEPLFRREMFLKFLEFGHSAWRAGRKLLIHCNEGKSRAPSLSLLFLSKVLYRITASSFDDAWDEFEALLGEPYRPNSGIETWLREHWDELPVLDRLPSLDGAAESPPEAAPPVPTLKTTSPAEAAAMVRAQPLLHFAGFMQIADKENKWIRPEPNVLQFKIAEAYTYCRQKNEAGRFIVLKPRQVGCSTMVAEICYHHMRNFPSNMIVMGDNGKRSEKVYDMFNGYAEHDSFPWGDSKYDYHTERGWFTYRDGTEGQVERDTALDSKAGIGGTRQVVWLTEAARYQKTGNRTDKKVINAVMNSLATGPTTIAFAESTADGAAGWFYETWQKAATVQQRANGTVGNGWIKIFAAWFEFPEHRLPRIPLYEEHFMAELDSRERRGIALFKWSAEQVAWRRYKIASDCGGDPKNFDQDFPEDDESCFLASGRMRFDPDGITRLEEEAKTQHELAETGRLDQDDRGGLNFMPDPSGGAWLWVKEKPTYGLEYIAFIDPCTGEQAEGSPFPDAHAAGVIRLAYLDDRGGMHRSELVAAIDVPTGCRWDDDIIGPRMARLARWYGDCMVVPETGNGLGVIKALRDAGAKLYQRQKEDAMRPGMRVDVVGWETNVDTRPIWVAAMAEGIRERNFGCSYRPAVVEMKTFVINSRGKAEAKTGCHDDWVSGIGIALACRGHARKLMPPRPDYILMDQSRPHGQDHSLRDSLGATAFS